MSVKSLPDAMRGDFWPRHFDFTHYSYVFSKHRDAADQSVQQHLCHRRHGADHHGLRGAGRLRAGAPAAARRRRRSSRRCWCRCISRCASSRSSASTRPRTALGLINNTSGLILPYVTLQLAISVLIMRSMFQLVPHEMFEAAQDRRRRPLADAVGGRPADGAQRPRRDLHRQLRHRLGRVSALRDADRRRGRRAPCRSCSPPPRAARASGPGRTSPPSTSSSSRPGIIAFTFAQKLFFKGLMEGALERVTRCGRQPTSLTTQQVVQAADAEPAVAVGLQQDAVACRPRPACCGPR